MNSDEKNAYIRAHWVTAPSVQSIASALGLHQSSVAERAERMGLPKRGRRTRAAIEQTQYAAASYAERQEQARQLAKAGGLSMRRIANRVGMSESAVARAIASIRERARAEAISDDPPNLVHTRTRPLLPRHKNILALLADAIREGWPCPSNVQIVDELDEEISSSSMSKFLETMEKSGLLAIQRDPTTYGRRRIWVPEAGKWTEWSSPPHNYREGAEMKPRKCMRCHEEFMSRHPVATHRYCTQCNKARTAEGLPDHALIY